MRVSVHPRVNKKRPEIEDADVIQAFENTLSSWTRATFPLTLVGVGMDAKGRLLEYIAVENEPYGWLIFHAMPASTKVLIEVGLRRQ